MLVPSAVNGSFKVKDFKSAARDVGDYLNEFMALPSTEQKALFTTIEKQHAANDIVVKMMREIASGSDRLTRVLKRAKRANCMEDVVKILLAGAPRSKVAACMSAAAAGDKLVQWVTAVGAIVHQRLKSKAVRSPKLLTSKDCDDVLRGLTGTATSTVSTTSTDGQCTAITAKR